MTDISMSRSSRFFAHRKFDPAIMGPSLALAAMFIIYSALSSHFLTIPNITNVLVQCAPLLILAAGQTFRS